MRKFRVCFAKRLSGKQQALDYDWDMQIPSNIRLELQAPRVERCGECCSHDAHEILALGQCGMKSSCEKKHIFVVTA